jgi:hypothetical protein
LKPAAAGAEVEAERAVREAAVIRTAVDCCRCRRLRHTP